MNLTCCFSMHLISGFSVQCRYFQGGSQGPCLSCITKGSQTNFSRGVPEGSQEKLKFVPDATLLSFHANDSQHDFVFSNFSHICSNFLVQNTKHTSINLNWFCSLFCIKGMGNFLTDFLCSMKIFCHLKFISHGHVKCIIQEEDHFLC